MSVIKRSPESTQKDLIEALGKFIPYLKDQKEDAAADDLQEAMKAISKSTIGDNTFKKALDQVIEAFEGEHELNAYTLHRDTNEWTDKEELAQLSSRVLSLTKRLARTL